MDSVEKAIRIALAKGDAEDRAFRERVYRSAFAALERATQSGAGLDRAAIDGRIRSLQQKISRIESEFIPAVEVPVDREPPFPQPGIRPVAPPAPATEPDFAPRAEIRDDRLPPDRYEIDDPREVYVDDRRPRAARRWFSGALVAVVLVVAAAMGGWWLVGSGLLSGPDEIELPVPNPPKVLEDEEFVPPEEEAGGPLIPGTADERNWLTVFSPSDPTRVSTPADALADVMQEDGTAFLRIRSGTSGSSIMFDVGRGVLEQIAGRTAIFNITARSEEGQETQIAVECNLGELGDCGRKRYVVGQTRADYLFEIALPQARPGSGGTIAINSDFSNGRKAVDIFEIRVAITE